MSTQPPDERERRRAAGAHEGDLAERIYRLEQMAFDGDDLSRAVNRLGLSATALGDALATVDRNQQRLTELGRELAETKAQVVPRAEHERYHRTERERRRRGLRRVLALGAIFIPLATYVAVNVHEVYRDRCDVTLEGPNEWCDHIFLFDADTAETGGNPLQLAVNQAIDNNRASCERGNSRAQVQIEVLRTLAVTAETPARRTAIEQAADRLTDTVVDCARAVPSLIVEENH